MSDKTKRQVVGMSIGILIHNMILFHLPYFFPETVPVIAGVLDRSCGGGVHVKVISIARSTGTLCGN
ncbi:MAG: hypothetical protein ACLR78_05775 [Roseburia sp.]